MGQFLTKYSKLNFMPKRLKFPIYDIIWCYSKLWPIYIRARLPRLVYIEASKFHIQTDINTLQVKRFNQSKTGLGR